MLQFRLVSFMCCVVVAAVLSSSALATHETTQPGTTLRVFVILTDRGISTTMFDQMAPGGVAGLVPARGGGVRGEVAVFNIHNTGKKPHNFALLGKKTRTLAPGRKSSFSIALVRRGAFPYESTLDKGKAFRGIFIVR